MLLFIILAYKTTVYREIFVSLYFHEIREFCSVAKLNFVKVSPYHTFYAPHMDHSQKYFFAKLLKSPFSRKFTDTKISRYTVFKFILSPILVIMSTIPGKKSLELYAINCDVLTCFPEECGSSVLCLMLDCAD